MSQLLRGKHRSPTRLRLLLLLLTSPFLLFLVFRLFRPRPPSLDCSSPKRLGDVYGDRYGGWVLCQPLLPDGFRHALVYTVGVGRNIEWDRAMINKYGTVHHGWDPTPTALDFTQKKPPPNGFHFHPFGLAAEDGNLTLKLPTGNHDSYTVMEFRNKAQNGTVVTVPVLTVGSMLASLHHSHLAILKIDIEGAEFGVIDEWSKTGYRPPTDQLLIEFHERYFMHQSEWRKMVPDAIKKLDLLGFDLVTRTRLEITFARREAIAKPVRPA